jgi:trimeric autotransporter adhesin
MALESTTYISGLVVTNPTSSDNISDGDNHIRLLKSTVKATFPNVTGAVTGTHTAINSAVTLANAATNANTASTIVKRDGSGNFSAGTITAALTGNVTGNVSGSAGTASTAGRWTTGRTITLGGNLSGSVSIRGDANVTLNATVANNSHTHTIANVSGLQAALNNKVDDGQVLTNVPSNAVFTDTNTTYSVGNGGLTEINFTNADHTKLDGIEANATADQTASQIVALAAGCAAGSVDGFSISTSQSGSAANTIYFRT